MLIARFQTTLSQLDFFSHELWVFTVDTLVDSSVLSTPTVHCLHPWQIPDSMTFLLHSFLGELVKGVFHSCFSDTFSISSQLQKCSFYYSCISFTVWVLANIFVVNRRSKCFFPFLLYFKILKDLDNHTLEKSWLSQHHILNGMQNWAQIYWRE